MFISKSSDRIVDTAGAHPTFGAMLVLNSDELLEGCQSVSDAYWQCDYRADYLWYHDEGEGSLGSYFLDAFISGVLEPGRCATFALLMWGTSGTNPQIGAGTLVSCGTLIAWEDES